MRGSVMIGLRCWMKTPGSESERPSKLPTSVALRVVASAPLTTLEAVSDCTGLGRAAALAAVSVAPKPAPGEGAEGAAAAGAGIGVVWTGCACVGGVSD